MLQLGLGIEFDFVGYSQGDSHGGSSGETSGSGGGSSENVLNKSFPDSNGTCDGESEGFFICTSEQFKESTF